jgi:glycosyltransferase involved in cell wall biosynthesis/GR25 family glycosyltransferase involved in LPS biosynthesis
MNSTENNKDISNTIFSIKSYNELNKYIEIETLTNSNNIFSIKTYNKLNKYIEIETLTNSNNIILWNKFCDINKISKVYIINLKRRVDRLIMMKFKLEKMGIYNYEIVEAVDGYKDENKILYQKYIDNVMLNNNLFCGKPQINSEGAYGILLTYKKLLYEIENNKNIIIFEDDIVFHKNFYKNLFNYNSNIFLSNDIVYLGANQARWNEDIENTIKKHNYYNVCKQKYYWHYGAYSIFLTPKIFNLIKLKLDDMLSSNLLTIDMLLWHIIVDDTNNIKSTILYPNLIIPQLKESDNMDSRDIELLADSKKWTIIDYNFLDITSDFKSIYDSIFLNKISLRQKDTQIDKFITNCDISRLVENKNKSFVFIIPSFNNEKYYIKNLESVFNQTYPFWRAIYIDDCSTDNTYHLVKEFIKERGFEDKVIVLRNEKNMKQTYSRYIAYNMCQDDEVCCLLDGDDWLYNDNVLTTLNKKYIEHNLLISYGQFYYYENDTLQKLSGFKKYKEEDIKNINFNYRNEWITQHLRTCEASLLKTIPESYLKYNGEWLKCCSDIAEMWWVLERSNGRHMNVGVPLYVYNKDNSLQYDNSYYNMEKDLEWKKYREDVEYYLRNYKHTN